MTMLNKHYIEIHPDSDQTRQRFICKSCHLHHKTRAQLGNHERHACKTLKQEKISCPECDFTTVNHGYLKTHIFKKHQRTEAKSVECDVCGILYASEVDMRRHKMRVHEDERRFLCDKCNEKFKSNQELGKHLLREHLSQNGPQFKCEVCAKAFYTKLDLKTHVTITHGEALYKCDLCSHVSKYKGHMNEHVRFVHLKEKPFKCKQCPKEFSKKKSLSEHEAAHEGNLQHQCESCSYKTAYKANYERHIRNHHDKVRYKCDKCGRNFTEKRTLRDHVSKLHENPDHRPFRCEICNKDFKCKIACNNHAKIHKEKNLKCDKCSFKTVHKISLQEHVRRMHEGEGFKCEICGAIVANKHKIKRHMKEVHLNLKPVKQCPLCPFTAKMMESVSIHYRKMHE